MRKILPTVPSLMGVDPRRAWLRDSMIQRSRSLPEGYLVEHGFSDTATVPHWPCPKEPQVLLQTYKL